MVVFDWGTAQAPHSGSRAFGERVELEPAELPEVRALIAAGWQLAPEAPMFAFLPAVWPVRWRTWLPDRATRYEQHTVQDPKTWTILQRSVVPATVQTQAELDDDADEMLAGAGVTGRPRGRLWLLKAPPGFGDVQGVLDEVARRAEVAGIAGTCSAAYVRLTAEVLRESVR